MGRSKTFSVDDALDKVMDLFWKHGELVLERPAQAGERNAEATAAEPHAKGA